MRVNYLEKLKNRSLILRQRIFKRKAFPKELLPVYIDSAPTWTATEGARKTEEAAKVQRSRAEKPQERPAQRLEENTRERETFRPWRGLPAETLTETESSAAAAGLLGKVRRAAEIRVRSTGGSLEKTDLPRPSAPMALPTPEDVSACFERDARRYDGAHPLM